jgi:hypothetical protein
VVDPGAVALAHDPKAESGQDVKSGMFTVRVPGVQEGCGQHAWLRA